MLEEWCWSLDNGKVVLVVVCECWRSGVVGGL